MTEAMLLREKIENAEKEITEAEKELEAALRTIETAPRADKKHIGAALERAFLRLKTARHEVAALARLVVSDP